VLVPGYDERGRPRQRKAVGFAAEADLCHNPALAAYFPADVFSQYMLWTAETHKDAELDWDTLSKHILHAGALFCVDKNTNELTAIGTNSFIETLRSHDDVRDLMALHICRSKEFASRGLKHFLPTKPPLSLVALAMKMCVAKPEVDWDHAPNSLEAACVRCLAPHQWVAHIKGDAELLSDELDAILGDKCAEKFVIHSFSRTAPSLVPIRAKLGAMWLRTVKCAVRKERLALDADRLERLTHQSSFMWLEAAERGLFKKPWFNKLPQCRAMFTAKNIQRDSLIATIAACGKVVRLEEGEDEAPLDPVTEEDMEVGDFVVIMDCCKNAMAVETAINAKLQVRHGESWKCPTCSHEF